MMYLEVRIPSCKPLVVTNWKPGLLLSSGRGNDVEQEEDIHHPVNIAEWPQGLIPQHSASSRRIATLH